MNERGDTGVGIIVLMAAMMIGMFLFGGHMMHKGHRKQKHAQESIQPHHEVQESTATIKAHDQEH